MTEMRVIKCDRCEEIFNIPDEEDKYAFSVSFFDQNADSDDYDLCEDCYYILLKCVGEFREAVDKAINEELKKKYPD